MDAPLPFNFELAMSNLDLTDVDSNSTLVPGDVYFVRWMKYQGQIPESWIGVVCDESMLPAKFLETRPTNGYLGSIKQEIQPRQRLYPVWLIGKSDDAL